MEHVDEVLLRATQGRARVPEVARALLETEGLLRVFDPADMAAYLANEPDAFHPDRPRQQAPPPLDLSADGKAIACVFTDGKHATAFANAQGMTSNGLSITRQYEWGDGVRGILHGRYHGMILDYGTPHSLSSELGLVRKLYGHILWDQLVGAPELYVLCRGRGPYLLQHDGGVQASAAVDPRAAGAMHSVFSQRGPGLELRPAPFRQGLEQLFDAGVTQLVINDELPDWHPYSLEELEWMRDGVTPN